MEQSPSIVTHIVKKFPAFYGIRRFITVFTRARHWSLSCVSCIKSASSHSVSPTSILILSSHLRLGLPSGIFLQIFRTIFVCISYLSYVCYIPVPPIFLDSLALTVFGKALHYAVSCILLPFLAWDNIKYIFSYNILLGKKDVTIG
jgi:hypothetical protein